MPLKEKETEELDQAAPPLNEPDVYDMVCFPRSITCLVSVRSDWGSGEWG